LLPIDGLLGNTDKPIFKIGLIAVACVDSVFFKKAHCHNKSGSLVAVSVCIRCDRKSDQPRPSITRRRELVKTMISLPSIPDLFMTGETERLVRLHVPKERLIRIFRALRELELVSLSAGNNLVARQCRDAYEALLEGVSFDVKEELQKQMSRVSPPGDRRRG
jgi:hypothetical protein